MGSTCRCRPSRWAGKDVSQGIAEYYNKSLKVIVPRRTRVLLTVEDMDKVAEAIYKEAMIYEDVLKGDFLSRPETTKDIYRRFALAAVIAVNTYGF